ncbi:MAG: SRPBCC family protein [Caulobacteraceae bacterium]
MTAATITPAPVRRSLFVKATPEHAFQVFTAGFDRWWPKRHSIGSSPQRAAVLEPKAGGRWYEVGEDGTQTQWGEVMVYEPPRRLVLIWRIGADWKCDPDLHTEVEVRFTPEGEGVRVDLEHRNLEAYGDRAEQVKAAIDSPDGGWGALLKLFAAAAEA